ncbi:MAG TPA: hypothetical protein VNZ86_18135, partial [Bacteroidia bacterium]|nr:hypothetical protein [Bacteroidia bacterium]
MSSMNPENGVNKRVPAPGAGSPATPDAGSQIPVVPANLDNTVKPTPGPATQGTFVPGPSPADLDEVPGAYDKPTAQRPFAAPGALPVRSRDFRDGPEEVTPAGDAKPRDFRDGPGGVAMDRPDPVPAMPDTRAAAAAADSAVPDTTGAASTPGQRDATQAASEQTSHRAASTPEPAARPAASAAAPVQAQVVEAPPPGPYGSVQKIASDAATQAPAATTEAPPVATADAPQVQYPETPRQAAERIAATSGTTITPEALKAAYDPTYFAGMAQGTR